MRQSSSDGVPFKVQPYSAYLAYATNPAEVAIQPIGSSDLVPTSDGLYSFSFSSFSKEDVDSFNACAANGRYLMFTFSVPAASSNPQIPALPSGSYQTLGLPSSRTEYAFAYNPLGDLTVDISSVPSDQNPFNSHNSDHIKISALPFRAYESIYNSFYRDDRNNPRIVDGRPEYNKYITTDAGGQDNTQYGLMFRNWEQDFLTTAVPSPQQGVAPLVGISSTGTMTFADPDDPDRTYQVEAKTADDADTIVGVNYLENVPASVQRSLIDVVSSGISINDFRNVNAYQRWLETNIRRGLKYKDQIKSHFDVNVSYAELDMPEFIGGVSQPVQVATVDQTSAGSVDNPLGSYAGQAFALGKSKHKVRHYCDEHGFIIGILSVVPVPNYSQLLPKYFLKNETLDYFFPEFGKIGYQPIRNSEVDPVNAWAEGASNVNNVFGYQRPWYDYLSSVDEVHGDFRLSLRSFLLNRVFLLAIEHAPRRLQQAVVLRHLDAAQLAKPPWQFPVCHTQIVFILHAGAHRQHQIPAVCHIVHIVLFKPWIHQILQRRNHQFIVRQIIHTLYKVNRNFLFVQCFIIFALSKNHISDIFAGISSPQYSSLAFHRRKTLFAPFSF